MTTFQAPLKTVGPDGITGNPQTETTAYITVCDVMSLGGAAVSPRAIMTIPPNSTLMRLGAMATSAFAADVSAVNVNWGNSAQPARYGVISVSALGAFRASLVSAGTDFDAGGTIVVTGSAVSTAVFTTGGFRAFIEYVTVDAL